MTTKNVEIPTGADWTVNGGDSRKCHTTGTGRMAAVDIEGSRKTRATKSHSSLQRRSNSDKGRGRVTLPVRRECRRVWNLDGPINNDENKYGFTT